jgi:predicted nucleotidyltransferase
MKVTEEIIREIKERIVSHFQVGKIILFGSFVYGEPKKGSDLDLLIIKESDSPRHKRSIPIGDFSEVI